MSAKLVDLPTPPPKAEKEFKPKVWKIIIAFFVIGLAMGACSLGMKLPVALYDLAVGQK